MSANVALVSIDDSIPLPHSVSVAFNRSFEVLTRTEAFFDRVHALCDIVQEIWALRWAGIINAEQQAFLYRKIRKHVQDDLGVISSADGVTAVELEEQEKRRAEWAEEETSVGAAVVG